MVGLWLAVAAVQISIFYFAQTSLVGFATVGIIGGADGPTSILMQSPIANNDFVFAVLGDFGLVAGAMIVLAAVVTVILVRKKHRR